MTKKELAKWRFAEEYLEALGVTRIDPTLRDISLLWASTRKTTARMIACKYLIELEAGFRETFSKEPLT